MNSYYDFAAQIVRGESLEDKLIDYPFDWTDWQEFELPKMPGRKDKLSFSKEKIIFPKANLLKEPEKKAFAIHSFANHELLAIEMMASAMLVYPHKTDDDIRFKKGILSALKDEQKHLGMYIKRLNELGYAFGDFPLNDFFWRQMEKLHSPSMYTAVMSLTFEAANLDFAQYYSRIFRANGDVETADILDLVLEDEISHVAFGSHWLKRWRGDKELWKYYMEALPWPMTPARSKGNGFDFNLHLKAVGDRDFVKSLADYNDDFMVTRRK
ncbi:MAG TPA: DUF455 family protein [Bacteriovoracaceae bacterium]|nr:DUF455 family protein [Bacteriovoracaceae bacterium]